MELIQGMQPGFPRRVSIIGAARSGIAAAHFFAQRGVSVFISDTCETEQLAALLAEQGLSGCHFEAQQHTERLLDADLIILSPGVPSDLPIVIRAEEQNIAVWSEMELGYRVSRAPFLAVTGSTGKSTTVSLLGAALHQAGMEHVVAGNIGVPVIDVVPTVSSKGFVVAEVSSFQLEQIDRFRPKAAAVLNLMKNHLDRYDDEHAYYNAKKEIARKLTKENHLILNANDPLLRVWGESMAAQTNIIYFGADVTGYDAFWADAETIHYRFNHTHGTIGNLSAMILPGRHNRDNASVAAALAKIAGADDRAIGEGICSFVGLPHRLEFVGELSGVRYYNDSKATTAESISCAIAAFATGVHLIAGGKDKGCNFTAVRGAIKKQVKDICLIGEAADRMEKEWYGLVPIHRVATLQQAIDTARHHAQPGEVVVFSPGCSSFDMFKNYEDRGDQFRHALVAAVAGSEGVHE